jgi:deoxyhypusine monooxygenase
MLKAYAEDPDPIVAHSCVVALDMLEFEKSGNFQYCNGIEGTSNVQNEGIRC